MPCYAEDKSKWDKCFFRILLNAWDTSGAKGFILGEPAQGFNFLNIYKPKHDRMLFIEDTKLMGNGVARFVVLIRESNATTEFNYCEASETSCILASACTYTWSRFKTEVPETESWNDIYPEDEQSQRLHRAVKANRSSMDRFNC